MDPNKYKLVPRVTSSFRRLTVSNTDTRFSAGSNAEARRRRWYRWASFWIEPLTSRNGRNGPPCPKIVISYRSPRYSVARSTATTLRVGSSERSRRELHLFFLRRVDIFNGLGSRHKKPFHFEPQCQDRAKTEPRPGLVNGSRAYSLGQTGLRSYVVVSQAHSFECRHAVFGRE